jgi:hypothetical protein
MGALAINVLGRKAPGDSARHISSNNWFVTFRLSGVERRALLIL